VHICGRAGGGSVGIEYHKKHDKKIFSKKLKNIKKILKKCLTRFFIYAIIKEPSNEGRNKLKDGLQL
jgi:hypothetical protein